MKSLIQAVAVAAAFAIPVASFAQSNAPLTRAQVRAELVQLEKAGWHPAAGSDPHYPEDIQAAQARVSAMNAQSGYGGVADGSSGSGRVEGRLERDVQPSVMGWGCSRSDDLSHRAARR